MDSASDRPAAHASQGAVRVKEYIKTFEQEDVTGIVLGLLTDEDLKDILGVQSSLHRRAILKARATYKKPTTA